ncbi:MAG TPA: HD domain-containing phosphohydrolase [Geobacteraceae bacterium]|nr:HD domain-containing phosphohydrolase [Geobacteraceae bacterium]
MDAQFVPVSIESIEPAIFPDVALYLKNGNNYVLYKSHGRDFSREDAERLSGNKVEFLFVSPEDMDVITEHMEKSAERFLKSDQFDGRTKGKIIYQTSINFMGDIFTNPHKAGDMVRSQRLVENLLLYISKDPTAITSLESVMSHNFPTFVHSLHVTTLSLLLHSEAFLLSHDEVVDIGIGCMLHDIGMLFVPQDILCKPGRLTPDEIAAIKKHAEEGYAYLQKNSSLSPVSLGIVRNHHERNNGSGYPRGLRNESIPRSAQLCAICDVYCNLTVDRVGNTTLPPDIALHVMKQEMKGAFNERFIGLFAKIVGVDFENAMELLL